MVRAGLIAENQLGSARKAQAQSGGTVAEHLVMAGFINDEDLTQFYSENLLVPRVNSDSLKNVPDRLLKLIPSDMAVEFRVIPVSLDPEQNLTLAMSDPSHTYAADEIGFFTGTYVVRAVATQAEIAWALFHYYGQTTGLQATLVEEPAEEEEFEADDRTPVLTPAEYGASTAIAEKIDSIRKEVSPPRPPTDPTGPTATQATRPIPRKRGYTPTELAPRAGELQARGAADRRVEALPAVVLDTEALIEPIREGEPHEPPILLTQPKHTTTKIPVQEPPPAEASGEIIVLKEPKASPLRRRTPTDVGYGQLTESARHRRRVAGLEATDKMTPPSRAPDAETTRIPQTQGAAIQTEQLPPPRAPDAPTTRLRGRISRLTPPGEISQIDLEISSESLVAVLRNLDRLETRSEIQTAFGDFLRLTYERVGFFLQRDGKLRVFPRDTPKTLPTAAFTVLSLEGQSTFKDMLDGRLPYRGPLTDHSSRKFIEGIFGPPPEVVMIVPLLVREKVVGLFYGDGEIRPVVREHISVAARAAGQSLERVLKNRKFGDSIPP